MRCGSTGTRAALWIALALSCGGCLGRTINGTCAWPYEPAVGLDLRSSSDQRHLNADARFAEELAIRYGDVTRGKRSGHFIGFDERLVWNQHWLALEAGCMILYALIATRRWRNARSNSN